MTTKQNRPGQAPRAADDSHDASRISDLDRLPGAALAYARRGWPVFPCQPGGKAPLTVHGFKDATTDEQQIRAWWGRWPSANVAFPTGAATVDVVDVDVRPAGNGWSAFNRLKRAGLLAGAVALVRTPSGGLHAYFPGSAQPCGSLPGEHIDFKASGGYVVAPPSTVGGGTYLLLEESAPSAGEEKKPGADFAAMRRLLAPPPVHQQRTVRGPNGAHPRNGGGSAGLVRLVAEAREGERNGKLFWAACRAAAEGRHDVYEELTAAAVRVGLGEAEARRTVASAHRHARHSGQGARTGGGR